MHSYNLSMVLCFSYFTDITLFGSKLPNLVQSPILEMDENNKLLFYKVPSSGKNMLCYKEKTHEQKEEEEALFKTKFKQVWWNRLNAISEIADVSNQSECCLEC